MNKDLILREKLAIQRTILANQTTLLSFIRTAMYFFIAGISANNLLTIYYGVYIEFIFIIIAISILVIGILNYKKQKKRIITSELNIGDFKEEYA